MPATLHIEIGLLPKLSREFKPGIVDKIIRAMLDMLGIETKLDITNTTNTEFLTINHSVCYFPPTLIDEVETYVKYLEHTSNFGSKNDLFWELLITHIIWLQPQCLFPEENISEYFKFPKTYKGDTSEFNARCKEIIHELLQLKLSLKDKSLIQNTNAEYLNQEIMPWNDLRERLIESLSSPEIFISMHPDYFDQLLATGARDNLFELMRDGLFYETGIKYPPFKILMEPDLPMYAFYFRINEYTTIPCMGLMDPNEILINDTPDRLTPLGIKAKEAVNPANGIPSGIIDKADREKAEQAGYTTWDGFGYFILAFSGMLRRNGYMCIHQKLTDEYLDTLKLIYPRTVELLESAHLESLCTKVLRLLTKDEISIRNMRVILEGILECDFIITDSSQYIVFDERIPAPIDTTPAWKHEAENVVEFVRTRLKKYISHKYTRGQSTLVVYLLDPQIEALVDPLQEKVPVLNAVDISKIHEAVHAEIGNLPPTSQSPVILTTVNVRSPIKKIIETRYPQVTVLSYQELSPEMNIQPIARISLS